METTTPLALRLKQETRDLHALAERSGIMADLLRGRLGRPAYCALLRNLQAIYAALEAGLDQHRDDAQVRQLWRPELRRLPALNADLACLHPAAWPADEPLAPATAAYVERLQTLAARAPLLLLAHAYLRYLGDLHGGQLLAGRVQRQFALDGAAGTAFYAFGPAPQLERLKQDFRSGLDALQLDGAEADGLVAEACDAFRRHEQLFEELQRQYA